MSGDFEPGDSVGNADIDAQHRHLLDLAASLSRCAEDPQDQSTDVVLEHLVRYMAWHFRTEESVMEAAGYPQIEEHRSEHQACLEHLSELLEPLRRNHTLDTEGLQSFLSTWLDGHLAQSDRKYQLYLQSAASAPSTQPPK